jgi:hypothetical protein
MKGFCSMEFSEVLEKILSALGALNERIDKLEGVKAEAETQAPEAETEPEPDGEATGETPGADSALALLHQKAQAAKARDDAYLDAMRKRGLSVGTADDFQKYKAARG